MNPMQTRITAFLSTCAMTVVASACQDATPIEERAIPFIRAVTRAINDNAGDPEKAARAVRALSRQYAPLTAEIRSVLKREREASENHPISPEAEEKLQGAINEMLTAAMGEKLTANPSFQDAMKAVFR